MKLLGLSVNRDRRRLKRQAHEVHTLSVRLDAEKAHAQQAGMVPRIRKG